MCKQPEISTGTLFSLSAPHETEVSANKNVRVEFRCLFPFVDTQIATVLCTTLGVSEIIYHFKKWAHYPFKKGVFAHRTAPHWMIYVFHTVHCKL